MMTNAENPEVTSEVHRLHGDQFRYHHTIRGIGPDGMPGVVEVYSNEAENWDERRVVHVLNGKVLNPW